MKANKNRRQMQLDRGIPTQQKPHTAENEKSVPYEYLFMLPSNWLEFEIELNSLS